MSRRLALIGAVALGTLGMSAGVAEAHTAVGHSAVTYAVSGEEDGSGRITRTATHLGKITSRHVYVVGQDTIPWDCRTMGNRVCGTGHVGGRSSSTVVLGKRAGMPHSVALTLTTTSRGTLAKSARIATDVDVEGEVY